MDIAAYVSLGLAIFFIIAMLIAAANWYKKVPQGKALVRTGGSKGLQVAFDKGMFVIPVVHMVELMDISVISPKVTEMYWVRFVVITRVRYMYLYHA